MNAITYPARPINGGRLDNAPGKPGEWFFEPKYNGWRALVHVRTGTMFNRHGERLTIQKEFSQALAALAGTPFEWLDCEALERRHRISRGTLLVFDMISSAPFSVRKALLAEHLPIHQCTRQPAANQVYSVKQWSPAETAPMELYRYLKQLNEQWRCEFYEGLVFKRAGLGYPVQLRSASAEFAGWVKHRWA